MIRNRAELQSYLGDHYHHQSDYCHAVLSWFDQIEESYLSREAFVEANIIPRMIEPDRVIAFAVPWRDDEGTVQLSRGWRVQHSNLFGPYKGGLRFTPDLTESTLKFLAFEQTSKNILTGLQMGGGKGGVAVDPKQLSAAEMERLCHAFMNELHKYIGADEDVPAGDVGVGADVIAVLYRHYVKLTGRFGGTMTGKWQSAGGSAGRASATGYGCIYMLQHVLEDLEDSLEGKRVLLSGAGNVAFHAALKAVEAGACVLSLSNSQGTLYARDGFTADMLETLKTQRLEKFDQQGVEFQEGQTPWSIKADIAIPAAIQHEISKTEAETLKENEIKILIEAANMPLEREAEELISNSSVIVVPSKAANAGGVAVSGLERTQNSLGMPWDEARVDQELRTIMKSIYSACKQPLVGKDERFDYRKGANVYAFLKWAEALIVSGC